MVNDFCVNTFTLKLKRSAFACSYISATSKYFEKRDSDMTDGNAWFTTGDINLEG